MLFTEPRFSQNILSPSSLQHRCSSAFGTHRLVSPHFGCSRFLHSPHFGCSRGNSPHFGCIHHTSDALEANVWG